MFWYQYSCITNEIQWAETLWKANSTQLVKKFPAFCGTQMLITVFKMVSYWSLFWAAWIQSTNLCLISWRYILILSSNLRLVGHPRVLLLSVFPTKIVYSFLVSPLPCYLSLPSHSRCFDHPKDICWRVQVMQLSVSFSATSRYFIFLTSSVFFTLTRNPTNSYTRVSFMWSVKAI